MKKRYLLPLILLGAAAVSLVGCGESTQGGGGGKGSQAVLDKEELTVCVGMQETLTLSWVDKNGNAVAEGKSVEYRWESSNTAVATVEAEGNVATVSAVAEGEAVVTVYNGKKALATCSVTAVTSALSFQQSVPEGKLVLRKDATVSVKVKSLTELTGEYVWESSDTSIGTVEYQGDLARVTAVARGECTITVRNGSHAASFTLIVGIK